MTGQDVGVRAGYIYGVCCNFAAKKPKHTFQTV